MMCMAINLKDLKCYYIKSFKDGYILEHTCTLKEFLKTHPYFIGEKCDKYVVFSDNIKIYNNFFTSEKLDKKIMLSNIKYVSFYD